MGHRNRDFAWVDAEYLGSGICSLQYVLTAPRHYDDFICTCPHADAERHHNRNLKPQNYETQSKSRVLKICLHSVLPQEEKLERHENPVS